MINGSEKNEEPKFHRIIRDDLKSGGFKKSISKDFNEVREFFLNDEKKGRLKNMGWFGRWFYTIGWLLKALFLKLTTVRRVLLIIAVIMVFLSVQVIGPEEGTTVRVNWTIVSSLIMLFILLLELKDKLMARQELEAGRAIQIELMPERIPIVPGWSIWLYERTANEVGGDLVDFQQIDHSRFRIALADLTGKGVKAALLSAKLQSTLRALAPENLSLATLVAKVNKIFYRDSVRSMFASLVYLEINSENDIIALINAGHFPPLIIRGGAVEELPKGDPGIGIFPEMPYTEKNVKINPDDVMIVYSDGLIDAKNVSGEFYGSQRLFQVLTGSFQNDAVRIGEKIIRELEIFVGDAAVYDDISLAVLMRKK